MGKTIPSTVKIDEELQLMAISKAAIDGVKGWSNVAVHAVQLYVSGAIPAPTTARQAGELSLVSAFIQLLQSGDEADKRLITSYLDNWRRKRGAPKETSESVVDQRPAASRRRNAG